jgi:MFS family permease
LRFNLSVLKHIVDGSGFSAFYFHEYRLFWVAAALSNIGMWALVYGRLWLMHSLTDSTILVGLINTATLGPVLLFSIWGGAIADRVNRIKLVRATRGMFAVLAFLTGLLIAIGEVEPWHVVVISVATGCLLALDIPSRSAMMPSLLPKEHLSSGIALYSIVFGGASIIGPALFSPLVGYWGIEGIFFLIGASYIFTVLVLMFMQTSLHQPQLRSFNLAQGIRDGLGYIRKSRQLMGTITLGVCIGLFGTSYEALLPAFSDNSLEGGIQAYSRLLLFEGIGGLIATMFIALMGVHLNPTRYMFIGVIAFGAGMLILTWVSVLWLAVVILGLLGGFRVLFGTMSTTVMQIQSDDEFRGRVMSLHQLTWGAMALGSLMMGGLAELAGVSMAIGLGGVLVLSCVSMVGLWMLQPRTVKVVEK